MPVWITALATIGGLALLACSYAALSGFRALWNWIRFTAALRQANIEVHRLLTALSEQTERTKHHVGAQVGNLHLRPVRPYYCDKCPYRPLNSEAE